MIAALIVLCAFLTSILSGIFGMAGGLILMGLLAWLLPITTALALHGMIQFASNLWRVILHRRYVAWRVLITFGMGAIAAMAFFALITFEPAKLYVFLGLGLMPILIWLPERWLPKWRRALWIAFAVNAGMFAVEIVAGITGGSKALQADALDFFGDAANYAISLGVAGMALAWRARAALLKGITLVVLGLYVLVATAWGVFHGAAPQAEVMGVIGVSALVANAAVALMLYRFRTGDAKSVWPGGRLSPTGP